VSVLFRRVRGRSAGHVVAVNPLLVREIQPTAWGGSEIAFSDVHVLVSRDAPATVQRFLEGRLRLCETNLCDHLSTGPFEPLCKRCKAGCEHQVDEAYEAMRADLVHGAV